MGSVLFQHSLTRIAARDKPFSLPRGPPKSHSQKASKTDFVTPTPCLGSSTLSRHSKHTWTHHDSQPLSGWQSGPGGRIFHVKYFQLKYSIRNVWAPSGLTCAGMASPTPLLIYPQDITVWCSRSSSLSLWEGKMLLTNLTNVFKNCSWLP